MQVFIARDNDKHLRYVVSHRSLNYLVAIEAMSTPMVAAFATKVDGPTGPPFYCLNL